MTAAELLARCGHGEARHRAIVTRHDPPECDLVELDPTSFELVRVLATGRYFPEHALDELVRRIPTLQEHVDLALPESVLGRRRDADGSLHVVLEEPSPGNLELRVCARPIPRGPFLVPGRGVSRLVAGDGAGRSHVTRDLERECESAEEWLADPLLRDAVVVSRFVRRVSGPQQIVGLLSLLREHPEVTAHWKGEPFEIARSLSPADLRVRVQGKGRRLLLDGEVEIDEERLALAVLLSAARRGERFIELGKRRFLLLEQRLLDPLAETGDLVTSKKKGETELPALLAPALERLLSEFTVDDDGSLKDALARARNAADFEPVLPAALSPDLSLRPYQLDGFRWLSRLAAWGAGAILADDMGLGKTVECLAVLVERASLGPQLVIAPTSVTENWISEAKRFAPGLEPVLYRGARRAELLSDLQPGRLLIASYDIVTRDIDLLAQHGFATLVLDEAQAVKNANTARARAVARVSAEWRVALTGTPVENHVGELYSIVHLVEPGLLGSWEHFAERFARPIQASGDWRRLAALRRLLEPFVLRRTKAEVLTDLPPRIEVIRQVTLSAGERDLYDEARLAALGRLSLGGPEARIELLAALTRLRRLVCHPRLHDERTTLGSSKLESLLEITAELREESRRALVFSQFTSYLDIVEPELRAHGHSTLRLDGSTPARERGRLVAAFQNGDADLFLLSLKAGGTGLNLTAADTAILLDPWWNPAVEDQASSRAHRMGQTAEQVTVIRLVAQGTIEERVLEMHADKRDLAAAVLSEGDAGAKLSNEELLSLLESSFRGEDDAEVEQGAPQRKSSRRARASRQAPRA